MNEIIYAHNDKPVCNSTGVVPVVDSVVVLSTYAYRVLDVVYIVLPVGEDHHTQAVVRLVLIGVADDFTVFGG